MKQPKNSLQWSFDLGSWAVPVTVSLAGRRQVDDGESDAYSKQWAVVSRGATPASAFRIAAKRLRRLAKDADDEAVRLRNVPAGGYSE